jgi:hypothetical protein
VRWGIALPKVGERVTSRGESWVVVAVEADDEDKVVCSLEPACEAGETVPEEVVPGPSAPIFSGTAG